MKDQLHNLKDWLDWQQTLHPKNIDFKLERIKSVYKKLNIKRIAKKIIIVAGTNGKGSTVAILESILHENNFSVGTFTSPHILNYNERIKINKTQVESKRLVEVFSIINKLRGSTTLTYFEFATLTSFYLFEKANLDYAILEVGLGGRLDATNIITSIGIDHTEFLGSTLDSIALEKAGVMRPFAPCIFADKNPPSVLLSHAKNLSSNFLFNNNDFFIKIFKDSWTWKDKSLEINDLPLLPLIGDFQYNHAGAAVKALKIINPSILEDKDKLSKGFLNIVLLGRYQKLSNSPEIIIDVAHNADSAKKLQLNLLKFPKKRTMAVLGVLTDKDVYSLIKPMTGIVDEWFCGTIDNERGMNSEEIKTRMSTAINKKYISTYPNMDSAFYEAIKKLKKDDRLIIYGSFYTVSEFLLYFKYNTRKLVNY